MTKGWHTEPPWRFDAEVGEVVGNNDESVCMVLMREPDFIPNGYMLAAAPDLLSALEGLGVLPEGYCFCFNSRRDATRPEHEHTGECRAARAAIAKTHRQTDYDASNDRRDNMSDQNDQPDELTRLRAEKAELVEAADALLTRTDFWRNVNVAIPGEYDDLSEAVARARAENTEAENG